MKRFFICLFLVIVLVLTMSSCNNVLYEFGLADYSNWNTVTINNTGEIKVPSNWVVKEKNNLIYFCEDNNNENIFLFQSNSNVGIMSDSNYEKGIIESNAISQSFQAIEELSYEWLMDGVMKGKALIKAEDKNQEVVFLKMLYTTFYVNNNSVDDDTLNKIAYSLQKDDNVSFFGYH